MRTLLLGFLLTVGIVLDSDQTGRSQEPSQLQREFVQAWCGSLQEVNRVLVGRYQEEAVGGGVTGSGDFLEHWMSESGATWSITFRTSPKRICVLLVGENWRWYDGALSEPIKWQNSH